MVHRAGLSWYPRFNLLSVSYLEWIDICSPLPGDRVKQHSASFGLGSLLPPWYQGFVSVKNDSRQLWNTAGCLFMSFVDSPGLWLWQSLQLIHSCLVTKGPYPTLAFQADNLLPFCRETLGCQFPLGTGIRPPSIAGSEQPWLWDFSRLVFLTSFWSFDLEVPFYPLILESMSPVTYMCGEKRKEEACNERHVTSSLQTEWYILKQ